MGKFMLRWIYEMGNIIGSSVSSCNFCGKRKKSNGLWKMVLQALKIASKSYILN